MLSGTEIVRMKNEGRIVIKPFFPDQLNPNSYNLCLGPWIAVYRRPSALRRLLMRLCGRPWHLDMKKPHAVDYYLIPKDGYVLHPGRVYLGSVAEYTETHGLVPKIDGRSSPGRLGLFVHATAGFGDHGFKGHFTLELTVPEALTVYADSEICQISYDELNGEHSPMYDGKYQNQGSRPVPSGMWRDFGKERMRHGGGETEAPGK